MLVVIDPPAGGDVDGRVVLAGIYSDGYKFEININQGRLNFIRNGYLASQPLPRGSGKTLHLWARWEPESIDVVVLERGRANVPEPDYPAVVEAVERYVDAGRAPKRNVPSQPIGTPRRR